MLFRNIWLSLLNLSMLAAIVALFLASQNRDLPAPAPPLTPDIAASRTTVPEPRAPSATQSAESDTAVVAAAAEPAVDEITPVDGKALYAENCVECHGKGAKGVEGAGSDIRDSIVRQVVMATGGGYEDMPEVELTDAQIEAIVAYLNAL